MDVFVHEDDVAYAGTVITRGKGLGVVVATGGRTALGRVLAGVRRAKPPKTELQVGGWVGVLCLVVMCMKYVRRAYTDTQQPNTTQHTTPINRNS